MTSDVREDWNGKVQSGGPVNFERAEQLAALTGLVRRGALPEEAVEQLGLDDATAARLLPLVERFVAPME